LKVDPKVAHLVAHWDPKSAGQRAVSKVDLLVLY
jgi:hypothetical protein